MQVNRGDGKKPGDLGVKQQQATCEWIGFIIHAVTYNALERLWSLQKVENIANLCKLGKKKKKKICVDVERRGEGNEVISER